MAKHVIRDSDGNIIKYLDDAEYAEYEDSKGDGLFVIIGSIVLITISISVLRKISGAIDTPVEKIILLILIIGSIWLSIRFRNLIGLIIFYGICLMVLYIIVKWIFL
jgi:hypothetical protein